MIRRDVAIRAEPPRPGRSALRAVRGLALLVALGLASGCATPVGVERASPREVQHELTASALSSDHPSAPTLELLTRLDLREAFREDPDGTIAKLRADLAPEGAADRLFALAELSFLRAERTGRNEQALAAAVYAYAFLFASDADPLDPFDPRVQVARNLYNRGLTRGLATPSGDRVRVESLRFDLPVGTLDVVVGPDETRWYGWRLVDFVPAADLRVRGLANRYRHPGIGAPLAASLGEPVAGPPPPGAEYVAPRLKVPATAFLRLDDVRAQLARGHLIGRLELYAEDERGPLRVDGREVPLERETSSSLAYMLEGAQIWDFAFAGFRLGDYLPGGREDRLVFLQPYRPGRIPLVLVHGTFSSPATWAELVNELENDPKISTRYQIWLFLYNTGNPIAYSGGLLVDTLERVERELDPDGRDPALQRMVVVGHSQGGLLAKLTAVSSGDRFWRNLSRRPLDSFELRPESRALLRRSLFYEPLPFVSRVVFMSTPHRGSYLASYGPAAWISRLVKMPLRITQLGVELATHGEEGLLLSRLQQPATSLDNMRPGNPFLETLSQLPIDPRIHVNSIVAVRGDGPPEQGSDGVVKYPSAHLEGAESELVVRSGHSVQVKPEAIQELRRILLEQAALP